MVTKRIFQTLSATLAYAIMPILYPTLSILSFLMLFSKFWFLIVLYIVWIVLDRHTSSQGGRSNKWVRNWKIWKNAMDYFPLKFVTPTDWKLEPNKNYIFCCHPHGVLPLGIVLLLLNPEIAHSKLSNHRFYFWTLKCNFMMPVYRDFLLALGFCDVSTKSINYVLSESSERNVGTLFPGGAAESYNAQTGMYHLVLKNRKGFIKVALKNGTDIVPVISFGEIDIFKVIHFRKGSMVRCIQDLFKYITGIIPTVYYGRSFLPVPHRLPIHIVAGIPIQVKKDKNPSQETIDALHNEYVIRLTTLFEDYKHSYLDNPESKILIID